MVFSHITRIVAYLAFILGLGQLLIGIGIASGNIEPYEQALARYTSSASSGEAIDKAIYTLLFAIALGTLAEISFSLRRSRQP